MVDYIKSLNEIGLGDVAQVGGKNASLGEMLQHLAGLGVRVPQGFATTTEAFRLFMTKAGLDTLVRDQLRALDVDDVHELTKVGRGLRENVLGAQLPEEVCRQIETAFSQLDGDNAERSFAVRSSATVEDMPDASFAGQQETFLNVRGLPNVLIAVKKVFASLFNDRAIAYRVHQGLDREELGISAGVQHMVRSDLASAGVGFTLDTESGFRNVVFVTGSYGLGESVVQGAINPDEFYLYKPNLEADRPSVISRKLGEKTTKMIYSSSETVGHTVATVPVAEEESHRFILSDAELAELGRQALVIEKHYGRPMDIEWAKDGLDGEIYIVQARPETVQSHDGRVYERYRLNASGKVLVEGRAVGQKIASGVTRFIMNAEDMNELGEGDVLVTDMTDPDWEPVMTRAAAIVTNRGGRTCHAAIIARELGVPAVVGCGDATSELGEGKLVTVSCAEGDTGFIYDGALPFEVERHKFDAMPELQIAMMMNIANPESALHFASLPHAGIGLARLEFIINKTIGVHPKALLEFDDLPKDLQAEISECLRGYDDPVSFYVDKLTEGIAMLAAAFYPERVIVRMSDFKSNEYAHMLGGARYEPTEENPMLGFRGASRYVSEAFAECFTLECRALRRVRETMGLTNVEIMVPFVRTLHEARSVVEALESQGLERGKNGLKIIMMCEIPSNVILAEQFLEYFDGFSIGSNDLTQLTLGVDRDSSLVASAFDERDQAVKTLLRQTIEACKSKGKYVGICGQGPSDYPEFAQWLMEQGIDSLSLNPDSIVKTWLELGTSLKRSRLM